MKQLLIKFIIIVFAVNSSYSQEWMTDLDIAQRLALVQNKMVLMVWEETSKYEYPVWVENSPGGKMINVDLFTNENISPLIWANFVPVIVSESKYDEMYKAIEGKRDQNYIDKFNDDSIKILDANGIILNTSPQYAYYPDITELINNYAFNTKYIDNELRGYKNEKNFYSAYYLASKYLDLSLYANKKIKEEIIKVSDIYLMEASHFADKDKTEEKAFLMQRAELLDLQKYLILERPKKVLRELKKMDAETIENNNQPFIAFLYFTAHSILRNRKDIAIWKDKVSSVNLKKAQILIKLNR